MCVCVRACDCIERNSIHKWAWKACPLITLNDLQHSYNLQLYAAGWFTEKLITMWDCLSSSSSHQSCVSSNWKKLSTVYRCCLNIRYYLRRMFTLPPDSRLQHFCSKTCTEGTPHNFIAKSFLGFLGMSGNWIALYLLNILHTVYSMVKNKVAWIIKKAFNNFSHAIKQYLQVRIVTLHIIE